ncbi:MAG: hypothetical protein IPJ49_16695 [Candidatus Obscuribacter sp.]|nr:hypothetical protein [Candidatus Obscuribacter sp.]
MKESSLTKRNESSAGVLPSPLRHSKLAIAITFMLVVISSIGFCQVALAQQNQKPGAGTTPNMPQNNADETGAKPNRDRYHDRNAWAKGHHDDDATEDKPGTKNQRAQPAFENFPMPAFQGMVVPDTQQPNTYRITLVPQTVQTKIQRRDVGNITRNYNGIGTWSTDQSRAIHMNQMASKGIEMAFDPERLNWNLSANASLGASSASNSAANAGEQTLNVALDRIMDADAGGAFINVANEASGTGGNVGALFRSVPDAVGMVMIMYKHVFVPMAILFLLPGAVISQVKGMVGRGLSNTVSVPEAQHPFDGILRSMVAVFLIPATQVIMSWSIDVGNSLAYSMRDWVDIPMILNWCSELSYDPKPNNYDNAIRMPQPQANYGGGGGGNTGGSTGGGGIMGIINAILSAIFGGDYAVGEGAAVNMRETATHLERQGYMMVMLQMAFNFMLYVAAVFLVIMSAFQITIMCYLFLLGPLSAAFYAWPQVNSGKVALFRGIFGNWLEAVIKVSLWRFYWMVVLAVVTQRLIYTGGGSGDLQWEVAMFASFLGIMLYVPQQPFDFTPQGSFAKAEQVYSQAMQAAQAQGGGGGGGGGKGGSPGGAAGGEDSGQNGKEKEHSKDTKTEKEEAPAAAEGTDPNRSSRDVGLPDAAKPNAANPNANPTANQTPPPPKSDNTGSKKDGDGGDNSPPPGGPTPGGPSSGPSTSAPSSGNSPAPNPAAASAVQSAMPSVPVGSASASGIKLAGGAPSANVNPGAANGAANSVGSQGNTANAANNNASSPAAAPAPPPQVVQAAAPPAAGGGSPAVANGGTAVANIATSSAQQTKKNSEA